MDLDDGQSDTNSQLLIPEAYDGTYLTFVKVHLNGESERERIPLSSGVLHREPYVQCFRDDNYLAFTLSKLLSTSALQRFLFVSTVRKLSISAAKTQWYSFQPVLSFFPFIHKNPTKINLYLTYIVGKSSTSRVKIHTTVRQR